MAFDTEGLKDSQAADSMQEAIASAATCSFWKAASAGVIPCVWGVASERCTTKGKPSAWTPRRSVTGMPSHSSLWVEY